MKRTLLWILAAIGGISIALVAGVYLVSGLMSYPESNEFNAKGEFLSPSGEYNATLYLGMGGGAAGWCNEAVTIKPKAATLESDPLEFKVFSVSCGSNTDVRWINASLLHIKFSVKGRSGGASVYLRESDTTGKVKIEYEVEA